jgi:hypothetical protein
VLVAEAWLAKRETKRRRTTDQATVGADAIAIDARLAAEQLLGTPSRV